MAAQAIVAAVEMPNADTITVVVHHMPHASYSRSVDVAANKAMRASARGWRRAQMHAYYDTPNDLTREPHICTAVYTYTRAE